MFIKNLTVSCNVEIKNNNFLLSFRDKEMAENAKMGQFVEIKAGTGIDSLIRKPISIDRVEGDEIFLVYKVVGKGTLAMSKMAAGEPINVIGPLGTGFPEEVAMSGKEILMVAGGIGIGPFPFVIDKAPNWKLFYGFRDYNEFVLEEELKSYEREGKAFLATNDGSYGKKGFVTDMLTEYLDRNGVENKVIFCCGPDVMMRKVCEIADKYKIESYISMEDYMGCGIGICVGCVRKIKNPEKPGGWEHKKVCKDGPVFKGEEIIWE